VLVGVAIGRQGFCAVCRADYEVTSEWVVGKRGLRAAWQQDKHVAQKGYDAKQREWALVSPQCSHRSTVGAIDPPVNAELPMIILRPPRSSVTRKESST
jgi:hypothetical protein